MIDASGDDEAHLICVAGFQKVLQVADGIDDIAGEKRGARRQCRQRESRSD